MIPWLQVRVLPDRPRDYSSRPSLRSSAVIVLPPRRHSPIAHGAESSTSRPTRIGSAPASLSAAPSGVSAPIRALASSRLLKRTTSSSGMRFLSSGGLPSIGPARDSAGLSASGERAEVSRRDSQRMKTRRGPFAGFRRVRSGPGRLGLARCTQARSWRPRDTRSRRGRTQGRHQGSASGTVRHETLRLPT